MSKTSNNSKLSTLVAYIKGFKRKTDDQLLFTNPDYRRSTAIKDAIPAKVTKVVINNAHVATTSPKVVKLF